MKRLLIITTIITALGACNKDEKGLASMKVRLTDAPAAYDKVMVNIQAMEIHYSGSGWQSLSINPGYYDLLELQNGVDTILAPPQTIPSGHITQMRLVLGTNNYVVDTAGVTTQLETPSAMQSGLKINVNETVPVGMSYDVLLDFDAEKSIVVSGNGKLHLKPVITKIN